MSSKCIISLPYEYVTWYKLRNCYVIPFTFDFDYSWLLRIILNTYIYIGIKSSNCLLWSAEIYQYLS